MNDIIKEFNMISLLGILLPGALLVALFGTEFEVWSRTCDSFGVTMSYGLAASWAGRRRRAPEVFEISRIIHAFCGGGCIMGNR